MIEAPDSTLTIGDAFFSFDKESLKVRAGLLQGQGLEDSAFLNTGLEERLDWLWQWSYWLDRNNEPLSKVPDDLTADTILRALFDYPDLVGEGRGAWIQTGSMPALPKWAAIAARLRWIPRKGRASQGRRIHAHRQIMADWLEQQVGRWEALREQAAHSQQIEGPYEAYLGHLRRQIESGSFTIEVKSAFQALLRTIPPLIELVEVKSADRDSLILMLKIADREGQYSAPRHQPAHALNQILPVQGRDVAEQRLKEVGYRTAILVSEMLQMMHCRRNQVAMAFILAHHGVNKPVFAITFKATQLLTYRSFILSEIGRRSVPDLPICKPLNLHELL